MFPTLPAQQHPKEMYKDVAEEVKVAALRRQAIQILGLPEEFCLEEENLGNLFMSVELVVSNWLKQKKLMLVIH